MSELHVLVVDDEPAVRQVLAAAVAPAIIPASAFGMSGRPAPSNRVVVAAIGLGFAWDMFLRRPDTQFVAVCDVLQARRDAGRTAASEAGPPWPSGSAR